MIEIAEIDCKMSPIEALAGSKPLYQFVQAICTNHSLRTRPHIILEYPLERTRRHVRDRRQVVDAANGGVAENTLHERLGKLGRLVSLRQSGAKKTITSRDPLAVASARDHLHVELFDGGAEDVLRGHDVICELGDRCLNKRPEGTWLEFHAEHL